MIHVKSFREYGQMKYGKYYATGLVALLLIGGGTGIAINHNNNDKTTETHKSVKSSSSSSHKHSSSSSSKSSSSENSSSSASSESQVSSSSVVAESSSEVQPGSDMTLAEFVNQYGVTPVQWLVQNKGMSVEEALYDTPDEQQTSGENQSEWAYRQGTHDQMVADNDAYENSQDEEEYWTSKAWEDNADFYGKDGTHYHNDDQGNTYDVDSGYVIGKGGAGD